MEATQEVAKHIVKLRYGDLPQDVVQKTKAFILDTVGAAVAGSSVGGCKELIDQMVYWGGRSESTIWVFGDRVPSFHAALANGMMADARNFVDTHEGVGAHCLVSVLPAALAAGEQRGGICGQELIASVALGVDLLCRMGQAIDLFYSWHETGILGSYGAAFAAGKILGLNEEKMRNAIGIAHAQTPGCNRQARKDGALTKMMQPGFAAMAGVLSANLALRGLTGAKAALEGEYGFFNLYKDHGKEFDPLRAAQTLFRDLGKRYEIVHLTAKAYPCCLSAQPAVQCALEMVHQNPIPPEQIESVHVYVSRMTMEKVGGPFAVRTNPELDAQLSIPFAVAVAIQGGKVRLSDFEAEHVYHPEIIQLAKRVRCVVRPELEGRVPTTVEVKTKSGQLFSHTVKTIKGHPDQPLTREEQVEKFRGCWNFAARPLPRENADRLIETIEHLETLADIQTLVKLLNGQSLL